MSAPESENGGFPRDSILLCASHMHTVPDLDRKERKEVAEKFAKAIAEARRHGGNGTRRLDNGALSGGAGRARRSLAFVGEGEEGRCRLFLLCISVPLW